MNASVLTDILTRHGIHPRFWHGFRLLAIYGRKPVGELRRRLCYVTNFKAALVEILVKILEASNELDS